MFTLPSGKTVEMKPMSAEEDLVLRDQKLLRKGVALDRVMEACVVSIDGQELADKDALLDLSALDRSVVMLELRKVSHGNEISFDHLCVNPDCGASHPLTFDLEDLKIHQPKTDQPVDVALPSGAKAVLTPPTGRMEQELARLKNSTDHDFLLKCLQTIDGEPPTRARFMKLSMRDLTVLRQNVKESFGFIDDVAVVRCEECGAVNRISLMTHPNFLFPEM
jgi:hypothetical protein